MSNRAKGHALRQPDFHRVAKNRLRRAKKPEPDGGNGGDTEGVGAVVWLALIAFAFIVIRLLLK